MVLGPLSLLGVALSDNLLELLTTTGVQFLYFGEYLERILWVGAKILHGLCVVVAAKRSTVGGAVALVAAAISLAGTLSHNAVADDERRALLLCLCVADGLTNLIDVVTVNLLDVPAPRLILLGRVLAGHNVSTGRELDVVGVVEHDEVVESQVTGNASGTLRNLLLYATVRDVGIDGLVHDIA